MYLLLFLFTCILTQYAQYNLFESSSLYFKLQDNLTYNFMKSFKSAYIQGEELRWQRIRGTLSFSHPSNKARYQSFCTPQKSIGSLREQKLPVYKQKSDNLLENWRGRKLNWGRNSKNGAIPIPGGTMCVHTTGDPKIWGFETQLCA